MELGKTSKQDLGFVTHLLDDSCEGVLDYLSVLCYCHAQKLD